jgi:ubiquinone/menaquinone biosynthesis C-methylase UbiE
MELYLYQDLYNLEERHWWHLAKRRNVIALIKKYVNTKTLKIADIGCGTGKNVEVLNKFGTTFGIDNSSQAIKFCKQRGIENVKLGTSEESHLSKGSIDLITMLDVLEHVEEDPSLTEAYRILSDKGYIIITVPAFSWLWSKWDEVLHHRKRYTKNALLKVLKKHHFKILKSSYMFSFLVFPSIIVRFIKGKIFKDYYPSDFTLLPPLFNTIFNLVSVIELKILLKWSIPFGTSVICIAQKDE